MFRPITWIEHALICAWTALVGGTYFTHQSLVAWICRQSTVNQALLGVTAGVAGSLFVVVSVVAVGARMSRGRPLGSWPVGPTNWTPSVEEVGQIAPAVAGAVVDAGTALLDKVDNIDPAVRAIVNSIKTDIKRWDVKSTVMTRYDGNGNSVRVLVGSSPTATRLLVAIKGISDSVTQVIGPEEAKALYDAWHEVVLREAAVKRNADGSPDVAGLIQSILKGK